MLWYCQKRLLGGCWPQTAIPVQPSIIGFVVLHIETCKEGRDIAKVTVLVVTAVK